MSGVSSPKHKVLCGTNPNPCHLEVILLHTAILCLWDPVQGLQTTLGASRFPDPGISLL